MLEVQLIDTFDKLLLLEKEWNTVLMRSTHKFVFLTFEWITTWWKYYGQQKKLLILVVRRKGEISCIAPLMAYVSSRFGLRVRKIELIGSIQSNWMDFVVPERSGEAVQAVIDFLNQCNREWDVIDLRNVPLSSSIIPVFEEYAQQRHFTLHREFYLNCFYLPLDEEWQTFLKGRNRKFRENLRRIDRKISKLDDIRFEQHYLPEEIEKLMDRAYEIEHRSHKAKYGKTIFGGENDRQFFRELARALSEKEWLILSLLKKDGQPIAYDFSFLINDTFYGYNSAYDKRYSELSPGIFLMERILRNLFQAGVKEADLYRGGDQYKKKWTQLTKQQVRLMIFHGVGPYPKILSILVPKLRPLFRRMNLIR